MAKPWVRQYLFPGVIIAALGGLAMWIGEMLGGVYEAAGFVIAIMIWSGAYPWLELIRRSRRTK